MNEKNNDMRKQVKEIFARYDSDKDGKLTFKEAKPYIKQWAMKDLGYEPDDNMLMNFFNEID